MQLWHSQLNWTLAMIPNTCQNPHPSFRADQFTASTLQRVDATAESADINRVVNMVLDQKVDALEEWFMKMRTDRFSVEQSENLLHLALVNECIDAARKLVDLGFELSHAQACKLLNMGLDPTVAKIVEFFDDRIQCGR